MTRTVELPVMNFGAVLRASRGESTLVLEVPDWDRPAASLEERLWRALHEVADPEFPISIVDLGLVYGLEVEPASVVTVTVSFTATACPCMDFIKWDIRERLLEESGVAEVRIVTTWDPPWTTARITERGRKALRRAGVSV